MQDFLITLLICSVTMSILALSYMVIMSFMPKRYSVKGRYYAFLIIIMGLIIPFRPEWNNAIIKIDISSNREKEAAINDKISMMAGNLINNQPFTLNQINGPIDSTSNINASPIVSWWQVAGAIWLAGMLIFLVYHLMKYYRFIKATKRLSKIISDGKLINLLQNLKTEMGITKRIDLYSCPYVGSPMMSGFIKPRIILPTTEFEQDKIRLILKHELIHYQRNDLLYKFLVLIATAMHWFNPVVHFLSKAINILCEMSCDAQVIQDTDTETRQFYSETIIDVVRYRSNLNTLLSTNFYGGKEGMKNRILTIMDTSNKKAGIAVFFAVLLVTVGTGFAFAANINDDADDQGFSTNELEHVEIVKPETEELIDIGSEELIDIKANEIINEEPEDLSDAELDYLSMLIAQYEIEHTERNIRFIMGYLDVSDNLSIGTARLYPHHIYFEDAAIIAADAILEKFDFCIDGMNGYMHFWNKGNESSWTGFIISEELTTHSPGNELFYFIIDGDSGEVLVMDMNTPESPFLG